MPPNELTSTAKIHSKPEGFSAAALSLSAQKKIASKLSNRKMTKLFMPDAVDRLFDCLFVLLKDFYPKKDAEKVVKNMIKLAVKICILGRNGLLDEDDEERLEDAQRQTHGLAVTIVSFQKISYSYDKEYFIELLNNVKNTMAPLVDSKMSDKSVRRLEHIFSHLLDEKMMDELFQTNGKYSNLLKEITDNLEDLLESNDI